MKFFLAWKTVLKQRQKCQKLFQLSCQNAWQLELVVVCCWCTLRNDFPFWNLSVRSLVVWYKLFKHKKTNLCRSFFTWLCLWLGFYTYTNMSQDKNLGRRIGVKAGVKTILEISIQICENSLLFFTLRGGQNIKWHFFEKAFYHFVEMSFLKVS